MRDADIGGSVRWHEPNLELANHTLAIQQPSWQTAGKYVFDWILSLRRLLSLILRDEAENTRIHRAEGYLSGEEAFDSGTNHQRTAMVLVHDEEKQAIPHTRKAGNAFIPRMKQLLGQNLPFKARCNLISAGPARIILGVKCGDVPQGGG